MLIVLLANLISNLVTNHFFYDHLKDQYIHEIYQIEMPEQAALICIGAHYSEPKPGE